MSIQEYLPADLGRRGAGDNALAAAVPRLQEALEAGRAGFLAEARQLARFEHASLAKVYRFFEDAGTAYMVMPLYTGPTLRAALGSLGHVPSEAELRAWLRPVLDALAAMHDSGVWHGNIHPDNIVLTPTGPVLLGLGGAEHGIARRPGAVPGAVSGYAAPSRTPTPTARLGALDRSYALAAVVLAAITGEDLPPAPNRTREDPLRPLGVMAAGLYTFGFLAAIDARWRPAVERPRDHLHGVREVDIAAPERMQLAPPRDLMQEPFDAARGDDRIVTVADRPLLGRAPARAGAGSAAAATAARSRRTRIPRHAARSAARRRRGRATRPSRPPTPRRAAGRPGRAGRRAPSRGPAWLQGVADGRRNLLYGVVAPSSPPWVSARSDGR